MCDCQNDHEYKGYYCAKCPGAGNPALGVCSEFLENAISNCFFNSTSDRAECSKPCDSGDVRFGPSCSFDLSTIIKILDEPAIVEGIAPEQLRDDTVILLTIDTLLFDLAGFPILLAVGSLTGQSAIDADDTFLPSGDHGDDALENFGAGAGTIIEIYDKDFEKYTIYPNPQVFEMEVDEVIPGDSFVERWVLWFWSVTAEGWVSNEDLCERPPEECGPFIIEKGKKDFLIYHATQYNVFNDPNIVAPPAGFRPLFPGEYPPFHAGGSKTPGPENEITPPDFIDDAGASLAPLAFSALLAMALAYLLI